MASAALSLASVRQVHLQAPQPIPVTQVVSEAPGIEEWEKVKALGSGRLGTAVRESMEEIETVFPGGTTTLWFEELGNQLRKIAVEKKFRIKDLSSPHLSIVREMQDNAREKLVIELREQYESLLGLTDEEVMESCLDPDHADWVAQHEDRFDRSNFGGLSYSEFLDLPFEISSLFIARKLDFEGRSLISVQSRTIDEIKRKFLNPSFHRTYHLSDWFSHKDHEEYLCGVKKLNLSNARIEVLSPVITQLRCLKELDLSNNQLADLPAQLGLLVGLKKLNVSNNQLLHLPPEIGKLHSLEELDASSNWLETLPDKIGKLASNLKKLDLRENRFIRLPSKLGRLTSLETLAIGVNRIRALPQIDCLSLPPSLKVLDLERNGFTCLPEAVAGFTALRELYLSRNNLKTLPGEIGRVSTLTQLSITRNDLETLPKEILKLRSLEILVADRIRILPEEFTSSRNPAIQQYLKQHWGSSIAVKSTLPKTDSPISDLWCALAQGDREKVASCFERLSKRVQRRIHEELEEITDEEKGWGKIHALKKEYRDELRQAVERTIQKQYEKFCLKTGNKAWINRKLKGKKAKENPALVAYLLANSKRKRRGKLPSFLEAVLKLLLRASFFLDFCELFFKGSRVFFGGKRCLPFCDFGVDRFFDFFDEVGISL